MRSPRGPILPLDHSTKRLSIRIQPILAPSCPQETTSACRLRRVSGTTRGLVSVLADDSGELGHSFGRRRGHGGDGAAAGCALPRCGGRRRGGDERALLDGRLSAHEHHRPNGPSAWCRGPRRTRSGGCSGGDGGRCSGRIAGCRPRPFAGAGALAVPSQPRGGGPRLRLSEHPHLGGAGAAALFGWCRAYYSACSGCALPWPSAWR